MQEDHQQGGGPGASHRDRVYRRCGSRLPHQVLRPARARRGVVLHRGSPEGLNPGSLKYDKSRSSAALGGYYIAIADSRT